MAALRDVIDALDTYIESSSGLEISCIKGYPDFKQPGISTPLAAIFYGGSAQADSGAVRKRVGGAMGQVVVTLGIYASDEINLFLLADKLQAARRARPVLTVSGEKIRIYIGEDEREPPDEEATKEVRHFVTCSLVLAYE